MRRILPSAVAIGVGLIVLLSYVFDGVQLAALRIVFTGWAVTLAGLAVMLGVLNVARVNARRIDQGARGWPYNLLTLLTLLVTIIIGIVESIGRGGGVLYDSQTATGVIFDGVVAASQAAIAALVTFALVFALLRLLGKEPDQWGWLFVGAVMIALVGWLPFRFMGVVNAVYRWLLDVPIMAGARGILIGVALGTVVIGLRVLSGSETPYRD